MKQYHKIIKTLLLFAGFLGILGVGNVFAAGTELNSGNITTFCATSATSCNLAEKGITSIAPDTFINHTQLQTLYLHNNQLTSLESGTFNGLANLTSLRLQSNQITSIEKGTFNGLSNLVTLILSRNQLTSLENNTFNGLSNVTMLRLDGNQLTSLRSGVFNGLTHVGQLALNGNKIASIEAGAFNGLSTISVLCLDYNQLTSLESGMFNGIPSLYALWLNNNNITSIDAGTFNGLSNVSMLSLDDNQLTSLKNYDFNGLTNIQDLELSYNQLTTLEAGNFNGLSSLVHLELNGNQITSIKSGAFNQLSNLTRLELEYNQLTSLEIGAFNGLPNLTTLSFIYNQITSIETGYFNGFTNLDFLGVHQSCKANGNGAVTFVGGIRYLDNDNCVFFIADGDAINDLENRGYSLTDNYYVGNKALKFDNSTDSILPENIIMQSYVRDEIEEGFLPTDNMAEVQYEEGTEIIANNNTFTGVVHSPFLFTTVGTDAITLMRFGALTQRIEFSQPVTIRMPALGQSSGSSVEIYSSDEENIYGNNGANWQFEKIGTVTEISGVPYVEFTTTHASRWKLVPGQDTTAPVGNIKYSPSSLTNGHVIATITLNEPGNITSVGGATHIFDHNGSFVFKFKDLAGNTGKAKATVNRIDTKAPIGMIKYNPKAGKKTNSNVVAKITLNEPGIITSIGGDTHIFTSNGTFVFRFQDLAGNTAIAKAIVDRIKKK